MMYKIKVKVNKVGEPLNLKKIYKKCSKCNKLKNIKSYHKMKSKADGYRNDCKECRKKQDAKYEHKCSICGKFFVSTQSNAQFCSRECQGKWHSTNFSGENSFNFGKNNPMYGKIGEKNPFYKKKHSEEAKKKMRENHYDVSGKNNPMYGKRGELSPMYGKTRPEHSERMKGDRHPNWNKDKSQEEREIERNYPEYCEWRDSIFQLYNYTCRCCGDNKGGNLNAHHIYGYSEYKKLRTNKSNGILLCEDCHKDYHKKHGYKNNNLEDFIKWLTNKYKETLDMKFLEIIDEIKMQLLI